MDPKIAKKTQDTLGKIIKKPPLTDKLLGKPPFRFLHDVVTSVIKTTGFMKGLYTDAEMNSENVKEKDGKIAFLQKAIDMVAVATGHSVSAKPAKIVAGHEPEKTNEFLQALAAAINAKVDNDECVKKVLSGGVGGESKKDRGDKEEKRDKDRTRSASRRKEEDKHKKEDKEKSHDREKDREKRHREREGDSNEEKDKERHRERREKSRDREKDKEKEKRKKSAHPGASAKEAKQDSSANATEAASATPADKSHRLSQGVTAADSGPGLQTKPEQERQRTAGETASLSKFPVKQKVDSAAAAKKPAVKKTPESLSCTQRVQMLAPSRVKHSNSSTPKSPDKHKVLGARMTVKAGKSLETSTHQGTPGSASQSLRSPEKNVSADPSRSPGKAFVHSTPPSRLPANPERLDPSQRKRKDYQHPGQPSSPVSRQLSSPVLHSLSNKASAKKPLKAQSSSPTLPTKQASKASPYSSRGRETRALRATPGSHNKPKMASALASQARKPARESAESLRHLSGKPGTGSHAAAAAKVLQGSDAHFDRMAFIPIGVAEEEADEEKLSLAVTENLSEELVFSSTRHTSAASRDADLTFVTNECREISSSSTLSQSSSTVSGLSLTTASDREKTVFPHHPAADSKAQKQIIDMSRKGRAMNSAAPKVKDPDDRPAGNLPVETLSDEALKQNSSLGAREALPVKGADTGGRLESTVGCVAVKPSLSHLSLQVESSAVLCTTAAGPSCPNQKEVEEKENESPEQNGEKESSQDTPARLQRPTSAKGSRRRRQGREARDDDDEEYQHRENHEPAISENDLPPQITASRRMARPPSARPAPPRPKQDGVEAEPAMRLGTGAPANLIVDDGKQSDDEDENFLVEEAAPPPPVSETISAHPEPEDDAEHGALVKKMLESKKEAEQQQQPTKKTEIERPAMSDTQRRKQRELVAKEIERLQTSIQSLTRSANPLGKIMDYVQEDMDSMQKELDRWRTENKEHALALRRERNVTDRAIEPLKAQLAEVDRAISDQLDLIAASKSNIIRNDNRIQKMLQSIARS